MTNNFDIILDEAFAAYNTGDFERAENLCREVLSAQGNHGDALFLLGLIAYRAGALEPAAELLFQAVKNYPDIENYRLTLASVLHRQGRLDEALSHYEKCPENPAGLAQQGFIYMQKQQPDLAKPNFEKALQLNPNLPEAQLGYALYRKDYHKIETLACQTNLPDAWYYLACWENQNHHPEKALSAIDKTGLSESAYLMEKGLISEALERWDDAVQAYRAASEKDPYLPDAWSNQANIFRRRGEVAAAEDYYKRALSCDSTHIAARHNLADLMASEGRTAEALEQYRTLLSAHPDYIPSLYNLAILLEQNKEYADALGLYFKILLSDGAPKEIEWRIADSLAALSETDRKLAADMAKGWVKNFPNNPVAEHTCAAFTKGKEKDISAYISKLYDSFAETYDSHMDHIQSHAVPELVSLLPHRTFRTILDLGCGTGAVARLMDKPDRKITGVDLSAGMLARAKQTELYDCLIQDDILSYLNKDKSHYDLVTAVEVLGYMPDITSLLPAVFSCLKKKGIFAFSVETTPQEEPVLAPHGRYLYPKSYITDLVKQTSFKILEQKETALRREGYATAQGLLIVLEK